MFQSYEETKYLGYDDKIKLYKWEYKIVDSEFEEIDTGEWVSDGGTLLLSGPCVAVMDTYENRSLNVAANLVKLFTLQSKKYGSISNILKYNKQFNPKFSKYEKDIEKYLVLI